MRRGTKRRFFLGGKRKSAQDRFFKEALLDAGGTAGGENNWTDCWFTGMPPARFFDRLRAGMSLNHIPGNNCLTVKSNLFATVSAARARVAERAGEDTARRFDFIPRVYSMPDEYHDLQEAAAAAPEQRWILKPKNASKGKGISIVDDPAAVPRDAKWLVQEYVGNPHLMNGRKYVLRLYALITSVEPLRLYLYREGSAKLASESYVEADPENLFAHLTNPDVNITNRTVETPVVFLSLAQYRAWLNDCGLDAEALFLRIEDMVTLTVIAARETMRTRLRAVKGESSGCYELLGIDCLVDEDLKPWLMECNLSPSLDICAGPRSGGEAEEANKRALVGDMLRLIGVTGASDRDAPLPPDPAAQTVSAAELENKRAGNFKRLFPADDPSPYLSCFSLPRLADMVLSDALAGNRVERPRLRIDRAEEIITPEGLRIFAAKSGTVFKLNESAAWIWLKATEGMDPDTIAADWQRQITAKASAAGAAEAPADWDLREQVWTLLADWTAADMLVPQYGERVPAARPETVPPRRSTRSHELFLRVAGRLSRVVVQNGAVRRRIEDAFRPLLAESGTVFSKTDENTAAVYLSSTGYSVTTGGRTAATDVSLDRVAPVLADHLLRFAAAPRAPRPQVHALRGILIAETAANGAETAACSLLIIPLGESSVTSVPEGTLDPGQPRAGGILVRPGSDGEAMTVGLPVFTGPLPSAATGFSKGGTAAPSPPLKAWAASGDLPGRTFRVRDIRFLQKDRETAVRDFDDALGRLLAAVVTPRGSDASEGIASCLAEWLEAVLQRTTPPTEKAFAANDH